MNLVCLLLAAMMVIALIGCTGTPTTPETPVVEEPTKAPEVTKAPETPVEPQQPEPPVEPEGPTIEIPKGPTFESHTVPGTRAVYATSQFGQKFSPFFYTTAYDGEAVEMVVTGILAGDRGGAVLNNGIQGETVPYNGTDYTYYGMANIEVVQNDDGSVDYNIVMRDDIVFSDGVPATIDDVIFGIYVTADPTYDGSSTIYALPIEGISEYYKSMASRISLIMATENAGYTENPTFTQEDYDTFWAAFMDAGTMFAQGIVDYVAAAYMKDAYVQAYFDPNLTAEQVAADPALTNQYGCVLWGFDPCDTPEEYFAQILAAYGYDISADGIEKEAGNYSFAECLETVLGDNYAYFNEYVTTTEGVNNIPGIIRTSDYSLTVHCTEFDATAIYNMSFWLAPLHYYGDVALYDYENNSFGFKKGDLSGVKAHTDKPLGAGPYTFESYNNGVVTLKANPNYYQGAPAIETLLMQEGADSDYVPGITAGTFDIAQPSISDDTLNAIKDANGNDNIVGDVITTYLVDYRGYGYIGINANRVCINGEPGSEASKNLRKGFMTLMAVYRDTVINSYYGDRAVVIQYPISNTSWAAPQPTDAGYKNAYSVDVDGNQIYTEGMNDEEKYAAAREAAIGFFKAAGLNYDEATGTFTDGLSYEAMIPGQGTQDHPAYGIAVAASNVLAELGITLQVNDVKTSTWNNALEANTADMWAAAWQASVDPDMYQVYHSRNANGQNTNSNHYQVQDEHLDELIIEGRTSADTDFRKATYKEAMEIIMDWGCELPTYQRKECSTVSTQRIDNATVTPDMTPFWGLFGNWETTMAIVAQ